MTTRDPIDSLLGQLAQRILDVFRSEGAPGRRTGPRPDAAHASAPPATADVLLPPRVGPWVRAWLNDGLGGVDRGGVFATYTAEGHEVRVIVRRARDEVEAGRRVAQAPSGPVQRAWRQGAVWYFASGGTVQGDEEPALGPGDAEAFEGFLLAWHAAPQGPRSWGAGAPGVVAVLGLALAGLLGLAAPRSAVAASSPQEPKPPFEVALEPLAGGHVAFHERTTGPEGDSLVVKDLDMTRPVFLGIEPVEPGGRLDVALYKAGQRDPVRRGQSDASGAIVFAFRTYDEVAIEVKSAQPAAYRVAVLVAPPIEPEMPSPFVAPPPSAGAQARPRAWAWPGAAALGLLLAGGAWMRVRRRAARSSALAAMLAVVAIHLGLVGTASGQPRMTLEEFREEVRRLIAEDRQARETAAEQTRQMLEQPKAANQAMRDEERLKSIEGRLDKLKGMAENVERWGTLVQKLASAMQAVDKVERLSEQDLDYEPNYAPPGMPQVPSTCGYEATTAAVAGMGTENEAGRAKAAAALADRKGRCLECFTPAYAELNAVRKKLENNRIVLANYTRVMNAIDDAGRGLGGIHGGLGVVYMQRKVEWDGQRQRIGGIYDQRYAALLADLQAALRKIAACEGAVNGLESWYDRFGFMYYEFMAARYKRTGNYGF